MPPSSTTYWGRFRATWATHEFRTAAIGCALIPIAFLIDGRFRSFAFGLLFTFVVWLGAPWFWAPVGGAEFRRRVVLGALAVITAALICLFAALSLLAGVLAVLLFIVSWAAGWILGQVAGAEARKQEHEPYEG